MGTNELTKLRNIGATVATRLKAIEILTRDDLERMGPVRAYQEMQRANPGVTLPRCYYLYSLEGALRDVHWNDLPEPLKQKLSTEAGLEDKS